MKNNEKIVVVAGATGQQGGALNRPVKFGQWAATARWPLPVSR